MNNHHDTTEILDTTNTHGTAPTAATRAPRHHRNAVVAGLALVGLLGAAAAGVVVVTRGGSDTRAADRTPAAVRDHRPATAPAATAAKTTDPQATNAPATGVDAPVVTAGSVAPLDSVPSSSPAPGGGSSGSSLTPAPDPAPGGSGSGVFCCVKLPGDLFSPPTPPLTIDPGVLAKLKPVVPVPGPFPGPGWLDFP